MSISRIAEELIAHYQSSKGAGHTRASLYGAISSPNSIVITDTDRQGNSLERFYQVKCRSLGSLLRGSLRGTRAPLVIDNSAMLAILQGLLDEIRILERELKGKENGSHPFCQQVSEKV